MISPFFFDSIQRFRHAFGDRVRHIKCSEHSEKNVKRKQKNFKIGMDKLFRKKNRPGDDKKD
ncbi:hypothetical protein LEP1GSC161_1489 [Leptospira santarosai str. CBC1416]|uniref:Uncharacterized protein n=1 Tax=Leptospira santarosai str. CBC1416 TaxID=1193059 RepID=M6W8Y1_9LEPT|nr:hypothetical protein LEP1GSC161_1489 [Leptospira santarosai str. CBC1416]